MEHLELWKLATDIGLCLSLMLLCYRFLRSPESPLVSRRTQELETALRGLVQEADAASKSLHDKLTRRQQVLEKLLFDLGTVESRVNRAITNADEEKQTLNAAIADARRIADDVKHEMMTEKKAMSREPVAPPAAKPISQRSNLSREIEIEVERDYIPPTPVAEPAPAKTVNIYGEEIAAGSEVQLEAPRAPRGIKAYASLSSSIEKEIAPSIDMPEQAPVRKQAPQAQAASSGTKTLEDIYRSAEQMLSAGKDLNTVATALKLPVDQVKLLIELMKGEGEEEAEFKPTTEDPRLGVLAKPEQQTAPVQNVTMKRQVQVL